MPSETVQIPAVGQLVYKSSSPQKPGKIDVVISEREFDYLVKVTWVDKTFSNESTMILMDFDSLIKDHQKKLDSHLKNKLKLKEV